MLIVQFISICIHSAQCGNYGNSLTRIFWQKFGESNGFTKGITKYAVDFTIFFFSEAMSSFSTLCSVEIRIFLLFRFYVRSILACLEYQKQSFSQI